MEEVQKETKKDKERKYLTIEKDGFKRFQGLIYIPRSMEKKIIQRYHDDPTSENIGKDSKYLYFPGMTRKIKKHIRECDRCQKGKIDAKKPYVLIEKWQHELDTP